MKSVFWCFAVAAVTFGVGAARANEVVYTFTGATGEAGTDWTLVDPSGFIPDNTNVVSLLTSSTDFFSSGVDYGPLIGLGDAGEQSGNTTCTNAATPCFEINMAITNPFTGSGGYVIPFFFAGNDATTGTFTEINTGSTLSISQVPEPSSSALVLSAAGLLGLMIAARKRNRLTNG